MTEERDDLLDNLLADIRQTAPVPSDALTARILADAAAMQSAAVRRRQPVSLRGVFAGLGGWPAVSGLMAATLAGVWVGIMPPPVVQDMTTALVGEAVSVSLFPTDPLLEGEAPFDG